MGSVRHLVTRKAWSSRWQFLRVRQPYDLPCQRASVSIQDNDASCAFYDALDACKQCTDFSETFTMSFNAPFEYCSSPLEIGCVNTDRFDVVHFWGSESGGD